MDIEDNQELELKHEQQHKKITRKCDIEDENKNQEITATKTPTKKKKTGNLCVTCNQRFTTTKMILEKKIYPKKANRALVKLMWQHFPKQKVDKQSYG